MNSQMRIVPASQVDRDATLVLPQGGKTFEPLGQLLDAGMPLSHPVAVQVQHITPQSGQKGQSGQRGQSGQTAAQSMKAEALLSAKPAQLQAVFPAQVPAMELVRTTLKNVQPNALVSLEGVQQPVAASLARQAGLTGQDTVVVPAGDVKNLSAQVQILHAQSARPAQSARHAQSARAQSQKTAQLLSARPAQLQAVFPAQVPTMQLVRTSLKNVQPDANVSLEGVQQPVAASLARQAGLKGDEIVVVPAGDVKNLSAQVQILPRSAQSASAQSARSAQQVKADLLSARPAELVSVLPHQVPATQLVRTSLQNVQKPQAHVTMRGVQGTVGPVAAASARQAGVHPQELVVVQAKHVQPQAKVQVQAQAQAHAAQGMPMIQQAVPKNDWVFAPIENLTKSVFQALSPAAKSSQAVVTVQAKDVKPNTVVKHKLFQQPY